MSEYFWLNNIIKQINKNEKEAWKAISELETIMMFTDSKNFEQEDERNYQKRKLEYLIENIDLKIQFSLESLNLPLLLKKYVSGYKEYSTSLSNIEFDHYMDILYSPALDYQKKFITILSSYVKSKSGNSSIDLERVLLGTPKIIKDSDINPESEADVRNAIYKILIHIFPDTVRELPISKVTKCYKPDFGIKSLKAAIEYKFVDNERDAKKVLGGIYEDIYGYEGSKDWKKFYAVIYMTDAFYTYDQIKSEFEMAKVKHSWKPILVTGKGKRRSKKSIKPLK